MSITEILSPLWKVVNTIRRVKSMMLNRDFDFDTNADRDISVQAILRNLPTWLRKASEISRTNSGRAFITIIKPATALSAPEYLHSFIGELVLQVSNLPDSKDKELLISALNVGRIQSNGMRASVKLKTPKGEPDLFIEIISISPFTGDSKGLKFKTVHNRYIRGRSHLALIFQGLQELKGHKSESSQFFEDCNTSMLKDCKHFIRAAAEQQERQSTFMGKIKKIFIKEDDIASSEPFILFTSKLDSAVDMVDEVVYF